MKLSAEEELASFFARCLQSWQKNGLPKQDYDANWLSPCQVGEAKQGEISWQPVRRAQSASLGNLKQALEVNIHKDIQDFYGGWYSDAVLCQFENHNIELIQAWNQDDFERLQENIIAHFLMQRRLKQPDSVFVASCEDEMQIVSVVNDTGEVQLEELGKGQIRVLAPDLATFLSQLQPA